MDFLDLLQDNCVFSYFLSNSETITFPVFFLCWKRWGMSQLITFWCMTTSLGSVSSSLPPFWRHNPVQICITSLPNGFSDLSAVTWMDQPISSSGHIPPSPFATTTPLEDLFHTVSFMPLTEKQFCLHFGSSIKTKYLCPASKPFANSTSYVSSREFPIFFFILGNQCAVLIPQHPPTSRAPTLSSPHCHEHTSPTLCFSSCWPSICPSLVSELPSGIPFGPL